MGGTRDRQTTLAGSVRVSGTGVHSGEAVSVTLGPAEAGTGFTFVRGGTADRHEPEDLGPMYSRASADPDGNGAGPSWMNPAAQAQ